MYSHLNLDNLEEEIRTEEIREYGVLISHPKIHTQFLYEKKEEPSISWKNKCGNNAITCMQHIKQVPLGCSDCAIPKELSMPNDKLPTNGQVLSYYFTINQVHAGFSNSENVSLNILLQWISGNVYTVTRKSVQTKLDGIIKL